MRLAVLFITILLSQSVMASNLKLDYSLFFGYMKTMYKLDYQTVTTAFYLRDPNSGDYCTIEQAEMVVDNKREAIEFQQAGRLLPFYSDQHRKDGATIQVKTVNDQPCALQITLMAKESELNNLNAENLNLISEQLEGVLSKNAGMIGRYFLPTYQGLRFKLAYPLEENVSLPAGYELATNGDLLVSNTALQAMPSEQVFAYKVLRITPWIVK